MLECGFPTTFFKWECPLSWHDCWCVGSQSWNSSIVGTGTANWSTRIYYKLKLASYILQTTSRYWSWSWSYGNWFCEKELILRELISWELISWVNLVAPNRLNTVHTGVYHTGVHSLMLAQHTHMPWRVRVAHVMNAQSELEKSLPWGQVLIASIQFCDLAIPHILLN